MNRELDLKTGSVSQLISSQLTAEGTKVKPVKPLRAPVPASPHSAIYKMHRYYARRPQSVFLKLIQHYSDAGDTIFDPFCGGGVTAVEALRSRRRIVAVDLNPLATWITRVEVEAADTDILKDVFEKWLATVGKKVDKFYEARCGHCAAVTAAQWFEWSNVIVCPHCSEDIILSGAKKKGPGQFECPTKTCRARLEPSKCTRRPDQLVGVVTHCPECGIDERREAADEDKANAYRIESSESKVIRKEKLLVPDDEFPDMDRARDDNVFGKGIKCFKDLMSPRQRISMAIIKKGIPDISDHAAEYTAIWLLFSSTLRFTNKFVFQSDNWQGGKPVEWAGHNYWLPYHYLELNPIPCLTKRFNALIAGKSEQQREIGDFCQFPVSKSPWKDLDKNATCWILTQSSHSIKLPDSSVDAVITDPPFGGNVQYGELSDFYLAWVREHLGLKSLPNKKEEAIETRHQGFDGAKDRDFYENMLFKVFSECRRVIKPTGWLVMTFHNREIGVWMALHRAALRAGFQLPTEKESPNRGMIYQPPVSHYTQTIHQRAAGSMLGDFVLSFKPVDPARALASMKSDLTTEEESHLQEKARDIIRYHGGADETTLMTGLIPYLHEKSLLHRLAQYDLRSLLGSGPFVYLKSEKKWFLAEMVSDEGSVKVSDLIPAEEFVQNLVYSYLSTNDQATIDQLLGLIYTSLVNSHRPQLDTIERVLAKYCDRKTLKGSKREIFILKRGVMPPAEINRIKLKQETLNLDAKTVVSHNDCIKLLADAAVRAGLQVHIGKTEQRKEPELAAMSQRLTGYEFGLPVAAFRYIQEIDLIVLKGSTILGAVEVTFSFGTFSKAVNERFRNLLTIAPNLSVALHVLLRKSDLIRARQELSGPANKASGLSKRVKLHDEASIDYDSFISRLARGEF